MFYSLQLWKHPNIHYREALLRLSRCELFSMLRALSVFSEPVTENRGGAVFLTFESRELSPEELSFLSGHSCAAMLAEKRGDLLLPLSVQSPDSFSEDLPEILKYKGKTNPTFTRMMLNTARAVSAFSGGTETLSVLDPVCGRGTTLFCALCMGASATGVDLDRRDLKEAADYFAAYLKEAGLKHSLRSFSLTVQGSGLPGKTFSFALSREAFRAGDLKTLTLLEGDASAAGVALKKSPAHLLVADLPYGIQHAPQGSARPESFTAFLHRVLPFWRKALRPGGAAALSFNTLTLKAADVRHALEDAGFLPLVPDEFTALSHPVEHAVVRDVVFATVPQ